MKYRSILLPAVRRLWLILALPALGGCQETLVFFEQTAFKLGISVNEEPPVPLEVTVGLKRRVVAIAPPKNPVREDETGTRRADGEAVSLLSRFDVIYHPDEPASGEGAVGNPLAGNLQIISAFASGQAAIPIVGNPLAVAVLMGPEDVKETIKFRLDDPAKKLRDSVCRNDPDCGDPDVTKFAAIEACWPAAGVPEGTFMQDFLLKPEFAEQRRTVSQCVGPHGPGGDPGT